MTSTKLVLPPGADSTKHIFGIALQLTDGYSSGVVWHQCTYLLTSSWFSVSYIDGTAVNI